MIATIIKREILEYLKSSKFIIGLCLTVVLIAISTLINIGDYQQRHQDFLNAKEEMGSERRHIRVYREPQKLSILAQGKDRKLGSRIEFTNMNLPSRTSGYMGEYVSQHHRYLSGFAAVDFAFIVRVVLSLLVIFLTYNMISEEKTRGTLKLMLSNHLPRDQLLLGKSLGAVIVVLGSLLIASMLSLLIMLIHPAISLTIGDMSRIIGMMGVSGLYLLVFFALGLFISVTTNRPSIALMILLQIWIFIIIIYPNLGVIIAEQLIELPSTQEIAEQKSAAFDPYENEHKKLQEALSRTSANGSSLSPDEYKRYYELWAKHTQLHYQVDMELGNQMTRQMRLAQALSILSPAVLYDQVMQRYANTDLNGYHKFMEAVYQYWQEFMEYRNLRLTNREAYRNTKLQEFTVVKETITKSYQASLPQWIMLFLFSVILFAMAYVTFLRKDVR